MNVSKVPGTQFHIPKDSRLRAVEEVSIAFPKLVLSHSEGFSTVIDCDDDPELGYAREQDMVFLRLLPGMILSLKKSTQVVVLAEDKRPRQLALLKRRTEDTERAP